MALPFQAPEVLADLIRNQLSEIRQTEALESQVHEMVVSKRQKLVALLEQFLTAAAAIPPVAAIATLTASAEPVHSLLHPPSITIGTAHPAQMPLPPAPVAPTPVATAPFPPPLVATSVASPIALPIAPEEAEAPLPPNPSAQQVMDSLNRLMAGLKEISKTKQSLQ